MVKVLAIDENDQVCRTVKRGLERGGGYWVFMAQNWHDGLKVARGIQPSIILLDIDMPDIQGLDFTRQLRARPQTRGIPVIALSTSDLSEARQRALKANVERCLTKPFDLQHLRSVIQQALTFRGVRVDDTPPARSPSLEAA